MSKIIDKPKRYRFQIQFDIMSDNEMDAYKIATKQLKKIIKVSNKDIIYMAYTPFASVNQEEINISNLKYQNDGTKEQNIFS
tara:strand:- start:559 stop:804 length:246 start_codon:yes stop_codon:yes gene_type:complete